jgi:hypothetical protein
MVWLVNILCKKYETTVSVSMVLQRVNIKASVHSAAVYENMNILRLRTMHLL